MDGDHWNDFALGGLDTLGVIGRQRARSGKRGGRCLNKRFVTALADPHSGHFMALSWHTQSEFDKHAAQFQMLVNHS